MIKLSIIIVVYNDKENLALSLESIYSQKFKKYEIIIIDGKSTDGTIDLIKENARNISFWKSESDNGIYDAMNKGILAAKGEFIHFLNSGDAYVNSESLSLIFDKEYGKFDIIYGEINLYDKNNKYLFHVPAREFTLANLTLYGTGTVNHQAFFVKRTIAPLYSKKYMLKGELNWYLDIIETKPNLTFRHIKDAVINYRQGGKGYKKFWQNLFEWILLVQRRFGLKQNIRNRKSYWKFVQYRFPYLKRIS